MDFIIILKAILLGLVEGATEFLPISSTGHLIIVGDLLNFNDERGKVFEIVIQLGAILAVLWQYRAKFMHVITSLTKDQTSQRLVINLLVAFMPAAVLGLAFHGAIKHYLFSPITVAFALIIGGIMILFIEKKLPKVDTHSVDDMDWKHALKVGCVQCLALFPGFSRAGATIMGGLLFGLSRKTATEFSFFLAIPIMVAATVLDVAKSGNLLSKDDIGIFAIGFITAFISALIAVRVLIRFVSTNDFKVFAWYRIIFGAIVLLYFW
jgi:undecaprenyl-diphosphatase